jgi:uncharacterized protein (TIGR02996 family)
MDEDGYLNEIAHNPCDAAVQLVYADWLEERGDKRAACLRAWFELLAIPYDEANFRLLRSAVERYRLQILNVDRAWVERLAEARDWVDAELAEKVVRLYLRTHQGRTSDRQWIKWVISGCSHGNWEVRYWRESPHRANANCWRDTIPLSVDRVTAEVREVRRTNG